MNDVRYASLTSQGMFEIYEQLLPTRLYAIHKTQASPNSDPTCRLCGTAPESMAHILSACPALAQTKYLARHDAVLKVLFFDIMEDLGLIEASPLWYSPTKPQPVYEGAYAQAYWDVPVFGEYQDLRANRIDVRIVNHQEKKVITIDGDELPLGEQSSKENLRKDDEIRATQMGAETEVPRVRDFTVQHHCGRTRGLVDRRGGSCEGASREASQRCPQEDAEGMLIRHTEHRTYF